LKTLYEVVQNVLIADNDIFFAKFMEEYFKKKNVNVEIALDGKEAIEKLKKNLYDMVIVDLLMPKIPGKDVANFVAKNRTEWGKLNGILPVIVLVSSSLFEQMDKIKAITSDYYVAKGPLEEFSHLMDVILSSKLEDLNVSRSPQVLVQNIFPRESTTDLLEEIEFFEALFESLPFGILILDTDTKILRANKRALVMLDRPKEDMLGERIFQLFKERQAIALQQAMKEALEEGRDNFVGLCLQDCIYISKICVSLLYRAEQPRGWVIILLPE
jgi:CheY-like chemotaxis protein